MTYAHWTMEEYMAGKCALEDVATPKPPIDATSPDPDLLPRERLRRDAILAYNALGGPEYLRRNPELLDKVLLKMVGDTVENTVDMKLEVVLKYSNPAFNTVHAIEDVTPKAIESTPPPTIQEITAARQSHLDANKAAREYDSKRPKPWLDKPPEPKAAPGVVFRTPPTPGTAAAVEAAARTNPSGKNPA